MNDKHKKIAIIIPYYQSDDLLNQCLQSIEYQTRHPDHVICICNDTGMSYPYIQTNYSFPIQYYHEPIRGSYRCRNRGIQVYPAEYYFFIDSDCQLHPLYLETMEYYCQENVILSGHIHLYSHNLRMNMYEYYDRFFYLDQEEYALKGFGATAALVIPQKIIHEIGLFKEVESGGDLDFGLRARSRGFSIQYIPHAIMYHPTRSTYHDLYKKEQRITKGHRLLHYTPHHTYVSTLRTIQRKKKRFALSYPSILLSLMLHKMIHMHMYVVQQYRDVVIYMKERVSRAYEKDE